ncbi:MAG TPA: hypothetical protein ENN69_04425, partial [Spirochaetia bacterium]|nr:hypothetical protein [Spirochaetia bacterium]
METQARTCYYIDAMGNLGKRALGAALLILPLFCSCVSTGAGDQSLASDTPNIASPTVTPRI